MAVPPTAATPTAATPTAATPTAVRTAMATVCISGTLEDKLDAAAAAGFDGVELFEPDLVASSWSPREIRDRCAQLGLSIDLYQPFRDFDDVRPGQVEANLRRAGAKFDVMEQLGTDLVLVCSAVSPHAVDDDGRIAEQLYRLATVAAQRGVRICYEALAWGTHVNTYERSWDIVRTADHPALGLCVDSFHILSRGSDPAGIRAIPADKLLFLQLADAPHLDMNVLQWSRHHRLFPGQGTFDLPAFLGHVLAAGYTGPLSLEVFNDVFRQSDPRRTAVDALRSLLALQEATVGQLPPAARERLVAATPPQPRLTAYAYAEVAVDDAAAGPVAATLVALGFVHAAQHRSKPVQLWNHGAATVLLVRADTGGGDTGGGEMNSAAVTAIGVETAGPAAAARRATALLAPAVHHVHGPGETDLAAVRAPDGTEVVFCRTAADDPTSWLSDFTPTGHAPAPAGGITGIDHVALTQPFDSFDEAALFYRSLLGLRTQHASEVAAPFGLVRNRAVANADLTLRLCLSVSVLRRGRWGPGVTDPQHVAFATDDVVAVARAARAAGAPVLTIPANYYDDLDARLAPDPELLAAMRELGVLLDRDGHGEFLHFYTEVLGGRLFVEVVQRVGAYDGYGELNGPIRMAAHRRLRTRHDARAIEDQP